MSGDLVGVERSECRARALCAFYNKAHLRKKKMDVILYEYYITNNTNNYSTITQKVGLQ